MNDEKVQKAIQLAQLATNKDREGEYQEALDLYRASLEYWMLILKYQPNPQLKEKFRVKMESYLQRAEELKKFLEGQTSGQNQDTMTATRPANGSGPSQDEEKSKLQDALSSAIVSEKPNIRWDDVAGLQAAKDALQEAVILPTKFPQLFVGQLRPWKGILLYGPPGTGKTFLAKACATESSATFYSISSSDLVSKWQGESERLVRTLFEMARANKPAIIFVDEVDSLCGKRSEGENDSARRIKTEFLVQMDGVGKDDTGLLVLGATNTPWDLDSAIRRRFERRVYIPLPETPARKMMIEKTLKGAKHSLRPDEIDQLAELTDGFSGADCNIFGRNALFQPLKKTTTARFFKKVKGANDEELWEPCAPSDPSPTKIESNINDLPSHMVTSPPILMDDFLQAIAKTKPSVSKNDLKVYEDWTNEYGQES
eukprot:GDKJ01005402.1.p1 GENE.GDKJ01005402.1~~GDKJ01005402.1.p1  ORF type:complete len:428 (+),score=97.72 GDKJ01005402.1:48-1331(+)